MKPRKPAVVRNSSRDKQVEILWNLPVRLDVLTDFVVSGGRPERVASDILDAASALACAKGTWYGQDSLAPIMDEIVESYALVSSSVFEDPYQDRQVSGSDARVARASTCLMKTLALLDESTRLV